MRNTLMIFTATALIAGAGFAQDQSESVASILKELKAYDAATPATETSPALVADAVPVAEVGSAPADVATAMTDEDIPAETIAEENQDEMPVNEFAASQEGIAKIVKISPENVAARLYPTTLKERDHRTVEVSGMKAVDAAWSTKLTLRSYPLADDACDKMELTDDKNAVNVENLFPQVDFPKGTSAIYQPKMKILFVRNTAENFEVLEAILDAMEVLKDSAGGDQVEIEAKFVEVSEGTLEELGFEWRTTAGNDVGLGNNVNIPNGQYLFDDALRGGPAGPAMPFGQSSGGPNPAPAFSKTLGGPDSSTAATGDWSSFRMTDTFSTSPDSMLIQHKGSTPIDLLISALDQSSGADVLSAPRVVTRSGEEATIRVGELHNFPEVFEGDTDQATMLIVSYQDFTEKLLGVELAVTPEVDGNNITLALNPRITELAGWQNYQMAAANGIYNHRQNIISTRYTHDPVVARLPIFKKREIETEVTISDGSTIGMGGLISERIESFEDKVPLLGSLPLVGRLFRNEGERAVKRNLLMFVTAKIVEPTGRINTSRSFE